MERMKQPGEEKNMYSIEFYEKENGESDVWDFLEELREKQRQIRTHEYSIVR